MKPGRELCKRCYKPLKISKAFKYAEIELLKLKTELVEILQYNIFDESKIKEYNALVEVKIKSAIKTAAEKAVESVTGFWINERHPYGDYPKGCPKLIRCRWDVFLD